MTILSKTVTAFLLLASELSSRAATPTTLSEVLANFESPSQRQRSELAAIVGSAAFAAKDLAAQAAFGRVYRFSSSGLSSYRPDDQDLYIFWYHRGDNDPDPSAKSCEFSAYLDEKTQVVRTSADVSCNK